MIAQIEFILNKKQFFQNIKCYAWEHLPKTFIIDDYIFYKYEIFFFFSLNANV